MDSHSEILGFVEAYFTQNIVQNNKHSHNAYVHPQHPASYTIAVKGVQKFNVTDNLFGNPGMDYELISGITTARVSNYLNAERNFWGVSDLATIRRRIFDFDDWNSHAITHFLPYYTENGFDSSLSSVYELRPEIDLDNLGGRLHESIRLLSRSGRPYVIRSDLTVMPGATLTIEAGATLEFYPSVGILVLGTLHAQGTIDRNIVMRPVSLDKIGDYRMGRQEMGRGVGTVSAGSSPGGGNPKRPAPKVHHDQEFEDGGHRSSRQHRRHREEVDVRLCTANINGTICEESTDQGFLEIYNRTTMQWVPVCDKNFAERNAQVVCKQLGFSDLNVYMDFDKRIEYNAESLERIIYWPEPWQCNGRERRLAQCDLRLNSHIYDLRHKHACDWQGNRYVFIHCGRTNLDAQFEYWGGVRFSVKEFEQELFHQRIHDAVTHSSVRKHESTLEYIQVRYILCILLTLSYVHQLSSCSLDHRRGHSSR